MAEKRGTGNYGSWGYGLETPIADRIDDMMEYSATKMREDPSMNVRLYHQGRFEALKEIADAVFEAEHDYSKTVEAKSWADSHSGYGRGDSMG